MARLARIAVPDIPYHVTQRGNRRQPVFFSAADYRTYLGLLQAQAQQWRLRIWAYCLMTNHVHICPNLNLGTTGRTGTCFPE